MKLVSAWTPLFETAFSVLNGGGVNHPDFPNTDPTSKKDVTARARFSQGTVDLAVSSYLGRNIIPLTGPDVELDKTRLGLDGQVFYDAAFGADRSGRGYFGKNATPTRALRSPSPRHGARQTSAAGATSPLATDSRLYALASRTSSTSPSACAGPFDPTPHDHDQRRASRAGAPLLLRRLHRVTVVRRAYTDRAVKGGASGPPTIYGRCNSAPFSRRLRTMPSSHATTTIAALAVALAAGPPGGARQLGQGFGPMVT